MDLAQMNRSLRDPAKSQVSRGDNTALFSKNSPKGDAGLRALWQMKDTGIMIVILLAIVGATLGWRIAAKRDGNRLDKLQYGAALMLGFSVIGLFLTLFIDILI
jgi:hypothetical protein